MHHFLPNPAAALPRQSPRHPAPVSCPVLSQIKPHAPLLVVSFRQFPLSFRLATILSPEPTHS
jgi:hypothetical protein